VRDGHEGPAPCSHCWDSITAAAAAAVAAAGAAVVSCGKGGGEGGGWRGVLPLDVLWRGFGSTVGEVESVGPGRRREGGGEGGREGGNVGGDRSANGNEAGFESCPILGYKAEELEGKEEGKEGGRRGGGGEGEGGIDAKPSEEGVMSLTPRRDRAKTQPGMKAIKQKILRWTFLSALPPFFLQLDHIRERF